MLLLEDDDFFGLEKQMRRTEAPFRQRNQGFACYLSRVLSQVAVGPEQ
jgi:hypothetical protein